MAMARVLEALIHAVPAHFGDLEKRVDLCYRQAHRIAVNRTVAGVHYPMDSAAGARLGLQMGNILVSAMTGGATVRELPAYDPDTSPEADFLYADAAALRVPAPGADIPVTADPILTWLWNEAKAEFALHAPAV
jgi:hypothetical protein